MMKRFSAVAASTLIALQPVPVAANPWAIIGFDSASIGKGNALTGGASGAAATYYNPAGLIKEKKRDISFSYIYAHSLLNYDTQPNPDFVDLSGLNPVNIDCSVEANPRACETDVERYNQYVNGINGTSDARGLRTAYEDLYAKIERRTEQTRDLHGVTIGMAIPLALNPEDAFAAFGVGIFVPLGPIIYYRVKGPTSPYFLDYDDSPHRIVIDAAGAIEIVEGLRVGIGADIFANVAANVDATILLPPEFTIGNILAPEINFQDIMVYVDGSVKVPITVTPIAGIQYSPNKWVDLGVRFRNEQKVNVKADAALVLESAFGTDRVPIEILAGGLFTPRQLAGGFAFYPMEGLSLYADATWKQWDRYLPPFAAEINVGGSALGSGACNLVKTFQDLDELVFDVVEDIDLPIDIDLDQEGVCDLVKDLVPEDINISLWDRKDRRNKFKNVISPALGASFTKDKLLLSGGYQFDPTPVPAQTGIFNILDANTHILNTYVQYQILSFATVGVHAQYQLMANKTTTKSRQRILDQTSDSDGYPDAEFSYPNESMANLQSAVAGTQVLSPGYPGYTVGGGYLSVGLQFNLIF